MTRDFRVRPKSPDVIGLGLEAASTRRPFGDRTLPRTGLTIAQQAGICCDLERERGLPSTPLILVARGICRDEP